MNDVFNTKKESKKNNKFISKGDVMKKTVISIAMIASLGVNSFALIVHDPGNTAMNKAKLLKMIDEYKTEATRWANTIKHYKDQIDSYKDELMAKTGIRDAVSFANELQELVDFCKSYGVDFMELKDDILNEPKSILGMKAKDLFKKFLAFDSCNDSWMDVAYKNRCRLKMVHRTQEIVVLQGLSKNFKKTGERLQKLSKKLANSQDIKESQDIGNAINAEVAKITLAKNQMELVNLQNERLDKIAEEQKKQLEIKRMKEAKDIDLSGTF